MALSKDLPSALDEVRARAFWAQILLGAVVATNLLLLGALVGQRGLLTDAANGIAISASRAASNDSLIDLLNKTHLGVYVVCAIFYLVWFHGAYDLLSMVGLKRTQGSAKWATFEWFIPILNLIRPYKSIVEMWHRSAARNVVDLTLEPDGPTLVVIWWLAFLGTNFSSRLITTFDRVEGSTIERLTTSTHMWMGFNLLQGIGGILAILVIRKIHGFQEQFVLAEAPISSTPVTP